MANGLLLQYVNKRKNDYKHFMGVSSLPSFELISKHISLSDANASGWGAWATHRFDFQSQSHSIEVWEDLWKPQLHGDYVIFHELTHLLDTENLVNGDKKKNAMVRGFLEYHASQIETIKILGYESIGENISFSMKQQVETVASIKSMQNFVDEPANTAKSLLRRSDFPKDLETLLTTAALIFNYYGRRSICLMHAQDYREDVDIIEFSEFIGTAQLAALDTFLKSQKVCPEYLYLYLQSETADKYIFYNSPFIQVTPSTINKILVLIPSDRMQELARLTFQAGHNTSQPIQIDRMNEFLREDKSINSEEHPFQSLMIEEFLGNIKMEKGLDTEATK